jgi:hypothetical protein
MFVVGVIILVWYAAAVRRNAPQLIDGYERRGSRRSATALAIR